MFQKILIPVLILSLGLISFPISSAQDETIDKNRRHKMLGAEDHTKPSLAYEWLVICQAATAKEVELRGARPTVVSRTMAIWATAMYDAWAAYDPKAVGSRLGGKLRRPTAEHTQENKEKAISYASYHA